MLILVSLPSIISKVCVYLISLPSGTLPELVQQHEYLYIIFLLNPSIVCTLIFSVVVPELLLNYIWILVGYALCRIATSAVVIIHYLSS